MGMDYLTQNSWYGDGSNYNNYRASIYQLFWCEQTGTRVLSHSHITYCACEVTLLMVVIICC